MTPKRSHRRIRTLPKPKLLLDEGLSKRHIFKQLNRYCDIKHIKHDYRLSGISDKLIYEIANTEKRIVVTFNVRDFKSLLNLKGMTIIGLSARLPIAQIDTKLTHLVRRLKPRQFTGNFFSITGETRTF